MVNVEWCHYCNKPDCRKPAVDCEHYMALHRGRPEPEPMCRLKRQLAGLPYHRSNCVRCGSVVREGFRCPEDPAPAPAPAPAATDGKPEAGELRIRINVALHSEGQVFDTDLRIDPFLWFQNRADMSRVLAQEIEGMVQKVQHLAKVCRKPK